MRYFIAQRDIDWSDNRFYRKGGIGKIKRRKSYIGLFDRNLRHFIWFKIIEKSIIKHGYIVERKSVVRGYWRHLLEVIN